MLRKILLCGLMVVAIDSSALAAPHSLSFSGVIDTGTDIAGIFTSAGSDLANLPFSATISYDPTIGIRDFRSDYDDVKGGTFYGVASPSLGGSFTLAGNTYNLTGNFISEFTESQQSVTTYAMADFSPAPSGNLAAGLYLQFAHPFNPVSDLDHPFTGTPLFTLGQFDLISNIGSGQQQYLALAQFRSFTVSAPSSGGGSSGPGAVPEPSAWALMIAGFGLTGAVLRGRRRANRKTTEFGERYPEF